MTTALKTAGLVPLAHPYGGSPWKYLGMESVASVPAGVVDWVLVSLRTGTDSASTVATRAAFIKSDGTIVDTSGTAPVVFSSVAAGSYYVVIEHRNHLAVMSHDPVALSAGSALYDFTTGLAQYYGSDACFLATDKYGLWGGDADASGDVVAQDRTETWNKRNQAGYLLSDVDLSGDVVALDRTMTWNNRNKFSQVP